MARLTDDNLVRARALIELYPQKRSALIPLLHLVQEQDGYLSPEGIEQVAELVDLTPAEVRGTASFYDMFHLEPIGKYLVAVCTNIACLLAGSYELLEHMEQSLGTHPGGTTADGMFTLEDAECLALCGNAPCVTVNWRYFGDVTPDSWDALAEDLRAGKLDGEVPSHGTLCRVRRTAGIRAGLDEGATETTLPPAGPAVELATSRTTPAVLSTLQPGAKATAAGNGVAGDGITGSNLTGNPTTGNGSDAQ
ncbi:MAG TPA: NAD(P)H-dependent oxidoreductase subunit E [Acidimicrobiales bacterium]|nr:NAD(P)H-dependent oxidoreductase subunit E [Acidimicrobiales bacterium]